MKRIAGGLCFAAAAGAALFLFTLKHEVRVLEEELHARQAQILRHQEALHVLHTEWSYLNQPARIADLARRHLDLGPIAPEQVIRLEDLPRRDPASETAPGPEKDVPAGALAALVRAPLGGRGKLEGIR